MKRYELVWIIAQDKNNKQYVKVRKMNDETYPVLLNLKKYGKEKLPDNAFFTVSDIVWFLHYGFRSFIDYQVFTPSAFFRTQTCTKIRACTSGQTYRQAEFIQRNDIPTLDFSGNRKLEDYHHQQTLYEQIQAQEATIHDLRQKLSEYQKLNEAAGGKSHSAQKLSERNKTKGLLPGDATNRRTKPPIPSDFQTKWKKHLPHFSAPAEQGLLNPDREHQYNDSDERRNRAKLLRQQGQQQNHGQMVAISRDYEAKQQDAKDERTLRGQTKTIELYKQEIDELKQKLAASMDRENKASKKRASVDYKTRWKESRQQLEQALEEQDRLREELNAYRLNKVMRMERQQQSNATNTIHYIPPDLPTDVETLQNEIRKLRKEVADRDAVKAELQQKLQVSNETADDLKADSVSMKVSTSTARQKAEDRAEALKKDNDKLIKQLQAKEARIRNIEQAHDDLQSFYDEAKETLQAKEEEIKAKDEALDKAVKQKVKLQQEKDELDKQKIKLQPEYGALSADVAALNKRVHKLNQEKIELISMLTKFRQDRRGIQLKQQEQEKRSTL